MPFHLAYTGPASTDVYFKPRRSTPEGLGYSGTLSGEEGQEVEGEGVTGRVAAFRGREVYEHLVKVPEGYVGCLITAPPKPTGRTVDVDLGVVNGDEDGVGESADAGRSLRKRKAAPSVVVTSGTRTRRKVVPVKRFALDSDEEEDVPMEEAGTGDAPSDAGGDAMSLDTTEETQIEQIDEQQAEQKSEQETPNREPLEHSESIAIVDTMISLAPAEPSITPQSQSDNPQTDEPQAWINTRQLIPEATFSAFSIWAPDEPMYTVDAEESVDGGAKAGRRDVDVRRLMGERDEFVRALDEARRVAEVVHGW